jgi:RNA polymerase sigma-70 factor (ECF subfamily)
MMSGASGSNSLNSEDGQSPEFVQTQWSLVRRAARTDSPESRAALENLCRAYWFPIYAFIRRHGHSPADAQDLTQDFFARLLASNTIERADPALGKFRTFLLGALKHFLVDAHRKADAQKRGGGVQVISFEQAQAEERYQLEPVDDRTPDKIFEQRWSAVLLEAAATRLREEFHAAGKARQFEVLKLFLTAEGDESAYAHAGTELNHSSKTIAVAVHRIRRRFRYLVRSAIADTVSTADEVEEEYQSLFSASYS